MLTQSNDISKFVWCTKGTEADIVCPDMHPASKDALVKDPTQGGCMTSERCSIERLVLEAPWIVDSCRSHLLKKKYIR